MSKRITQGGHLYVYDSSHNAPAVYFTLRPLGSSERRPVGYDSLPFFPSSGKNAPFRTLEGGAYSSTRRNLAASDSVSAADGARAYRY